MYTNWITLIGGGITAAATLAVGISTSGIFAASPADQTSVPAAGETIYVEQPVFEVPGAGSLVVPASSDPIVIAILPATPAAGGSAASAPTADDPAVSPDPAEPTPPAEEDDGVIEDEDGEYEDDYDGPEEGGDEGHEGGEDGGYDGPEEGGDEGHEGGEDD